MIINMFGRKYALYCDECRSKYAFKSKKELRAFKLGSDKCCPNCGEGLSQIPFADYVIPLPPVPAIFVLQTNENKNYIEEFIEKVNKPISKEEKRSLMGIALLMNDKAWFNELSEDIDQNT